MGATLYTNRAAMSALYVIENLSNRMEGLQTRISTGKRINAAKDNSAYWTISNNMMSDSEAGRPIKDALTMAKIQLDQGYSATQQIRKELESIKKEMITAYGMTAEDQKKVRAAVEARLENIKMSLKNGEFNGTNLTDITDGVTSGAAVGTSMDVPASFRRVGDKVEVNTIQIDKTKLSLTHVETAEKPDKPQKADETDKTQAPTEPFDIRDLWNTQLFSDKTNGEAYSASELDGMVSRVQKQLNAVSEVESHYAAYQNQIDSQLSYVAKISDNLEIGVGTLTDADMNAESSKLSALQIQQQLAVQGLAIANQANQNLLSLFR